MSGKRDSPRATTEAINGVNASAEAQDASGDASSNQARYETNVVVFVNDGSARTGMALTVEPGWTMGKLAEEAALLLDMEERASYRVFALTNRNRGREVFDIAAITEHDELVITLGEDLVPFKVLACGNGGEGQLGLARNVMEKEYTTKDYGFDLPHLVPSLSGASIVQIACGREHTVFRSEDSFLFACGKNFHGQLGVCSMKQLRQPAFHPPVAVAEPQVVSLPDCYLCVDVAAGEFHTVALVTVVGDPRQVEVFAWGCGDQGRLGIGNGFDFDGKGEKIVRRNPADEFAPQPVLALQSRHISRVSAGGAASAAISREGRLFTWGKGSTGCLGHVLEAPSERGKEEEEGDGDKAKGSSVFNRFNTQTARDKWDAATVMMSLRVDEDPKLFDAAQEALEEAKGGQLGEHGVVAVFTLGEEEGDDHAVAKCAKEVRSGSDQLAKLEESTLTGPVLHSCHVDVAEDGPVERGSGRSVETIQEELKSALELTAAPRVRFAVADVQDAHFPREVSLLRSRRVLAAAFGFRHTVAIAESLDGNGGTSVLSWGQGHYGELGYLPAAAADAKAADAGAHAMRGVKEEVVLREAGGEGEEGPGDLIAVFGSDAYGRALRGNGAPATTPATGPPAYSAVPREVPALQNRGVIQVSCGAHHTLFLCEDGAVWACGDGRAGQLGIREKHLRSEVPNRRRPPPLCLYRPTALASSALGRGRVIHVAAGGCSSACVTSEGTVYTWGRGKGGCLGSGATENALSPTKVDVVSDQLISFVAMGGSGNGGTCHTHMLSLQYRRAYPSPQTIRKRLVEGLPLPSDPERFISRETDLPLGYVLTCCATDRKATADQGADAAPVCTIV